MLALAGYPLGIRCTVLDPAAESCAAQVCAHIRGEFDDFQALYELAKASDVVTFEFENVPVETARWLAERVPVFPPPRALEVSQERLAEKQFFASLGIPTPPFAAVDTRGEFDAAVRDIGLPAVLKTRRFGYDGKGQAVLRTAGRVRGGLGEARRPAAHSRRVRASSTASSRSSPCAAATGRSPPTRSSRTSTATASCTARSPRPPTPARN